MATSSVTVLCPNAHRVVVKTTPNTSILQILEEACTKHKYNPDLYYLKHLKRTLDVGCTLRFAGVPNRCVLEMGALATPRMQQTVTICVIDEQGAKHVRQHQPTASLWSVLEESGVLGDADQHVGKLPVVVFSMRRVAGQSALTATTLKMLGLNSGSGSLRFLRQGTSEEVPPAPAADNSAAPQIIPENIQPERVPVNLHQEILPINIQPEIIPVNIQPEVIHANLQPEVIHANLQPEVIPANLQPEIIPVNVQPEIIPVNVQPEVIPINVQPEIIPANIQPEVVINGGCSRGSVDNIALEEREANDVIMENNSGEVGGASVAVGGVTEQVGEANVLSPDVVSSSQGCAVPDVLMRPDETVSTPDVLHNQSGCSSTSSTSMTAFSGSGHTLTVSPICGGSADSVATGDTTITTHQQQPSQLMEVDSTQDTALIALSSHNAVVFRGSDMAAETGRFVEEDDSFFKLTADDVRRQHRERMRELQVLEEAPLLTLGLREAEQQNKLLAAINKFPVTQLRIHFPDDVVVQASFRPTDTVQDVAVFVVGLLNNEATEFDLLSHYPRSVLERSSSLHAAGLVPKARIHCCLSSPGNSAPQDSVALLQPTVLANITSYEQAKTALVTARGSTVGTEATGGGLTQEAADAGATRTHTGHVSTGGATAKKPKWFKLGN